MELTGKDVTLSKFISLVLRHNPLLIHVYMDDKGWVDIDQLIRYSAKYANQHFTREDLERVVVNNNKQRFTIDGNKIRANQGHSIEVNLELVPQTPPATLYHGTAEKTVPFILQDGIKKMNRQYVHLSLTKETARTVGSRHGSVAILCVNAQKMVADGVLFYCSKNGVWLTDYVSPHYITIDSQ